MPALDHLVYGVPDLLDGVAQFAASTGVRPVSGGRHEGRGTANYLVGLGEGRYLEIIGPDPDADHPDDPPLPFGIESLAAPRLLTWCVRPSDLDQCLVDARARGYEPGEPTPMSRRTATGELLTWRLTPDSTGDGGLLPFLIDWGSSAHPSAAKLPQLRLVSLRATSPQPAVVRRSLATIGLILDVHEGDHSALRATLETPNGEVVLS